MPKSIRPDRREVSRRVEPGAPERMEVQMRFPSPRRRLFGLVAAAAVAPVVTACLFLPFAVAPLDAGMMLLSLLFIALMALLLGFLGALAFLAPALLAAERLGEPPWSFVGGGLIAGFAHTAVGSALADPETQT